MHGKKRAEYKARLNDPKTATVLSQKAQQWHALMKELYQRRRDSREDGTDDDTYDRETAKVTLSLLEKALMVNPDPLHLWNHRRDILTRQEEKRIVDNLDGVEPSASVPASLGCDGVDDPKPLSFDAARDCNLTTTSATTTSSMMLSLLETELPLTQAALQRNPKAYGAWMHRKWVLSSVKPPPLVLEQELALTTQFLSLDERNFHCWNYRRFVVGCLAAAKARAVHSSSSTSSPSRTWTGLWLVELDAAAGAIQELMGPQIVQRQVQREKEISTDINAGCDGEKMSSDNEEVSTTMPIDLIRSEFDFTTTKIKDNFSNFSAFHYRCQLLDVLISSLLSSSNGQHHDQSGVVVGDMLAQEFQLMEDAFCTEPDDQTAWWYHSILLDKIMYTRQRSQSSANAVAWMSRDKLLARLNDQAELLRELLEESPRGKWVMLGLARVLEILIDCGENSEEDDDDDNVSNLKNERRDLLDKLVEIDPDRGQRYKDMQ